MRTDEKFRVLAGWIIVVALAVGWCVPSLAVNGEPVEFDIGQWENGFLASVTRVRTEYEDTTASTCHDGAPWCCKSRTSPYTKLAHYHTDDADELSPTEITRANEFAEHLEIWLDDELAGNRLSGDDGNASIRKNCHAWALDYDQWLTHGASLRVLTDDYDPVGVGEEVKVNYRCLHNCNHTSIVTDVTPDKCDPSEVKSKWGTYGVYKTGPDIWCGVEYVKYPE